VRSSTTPNHSQRYSLTGHQVKLGKLKRYLLGALVSAQLLVIAGCAHASSSIPEVPNSSGIGQVGWIEPEWMPEARDAVNNYQREMLNCLASFGVDGILSIGVGAVGVPFARDSEGNFDSELNQRYNHAEEYCLETVPQPPHLPQPPEFEINPTFEDYSRMLEVRECLLHHGAFVPQPPEKEDWIRSRYPWNPWAAASFETPIEVEELQSLMDICPQDGISIQKHFWDLRD